MTTDEAIEQLRGLQSQIIHGGNTFGDLADHLAGLQCSWRMRNAEYRRLSTKEENARMEVNRLTVENEQLQQLIRAAGVDLKPSPVEEKYNVASERQPTEDVQ